ncbi:lambda family phage portal protein [Sedimentibacter acidaminivorans]|uniref:Lambda family phage portal protein n=1 Tax=Sedimentibacter acidaminivorans TaxID=913099 RepID=A0ABS4GA97_9FIRM|nr:phage portal protein [Sedimentibacter acidaminivorans]MBP1924602.1 lambda family phage portal protein [Sedimentibacter acidaminivorans]
MNVLDKAIGYVSPNTALKREVARQKIKMINSGYGEHGASSKKKSLVGWLIRSSSVLEDIEQNIPKLRGRSRDLYMGAPLATGALKTIRTNVVGSGLRLNAQIDYEYLGMTLEEADAWETKVEREFNLWAESIHCDAQRMNNFYELQQLALISQLMSGDCLATLPLIPRVYMPYDLRINIIEADRVCNPNNYIDFDNKIVNGVEINTYGEVVAYHIAQKHPGTVMLSKNKWVRVRKFGERTGRPNVIHLMESERPEQRRGVPILAPVIESLKQLTRYTEAELMAAVISGMYTVFIKTESPDTEAPGQYVSPVDQLEDDDDNINYELGNGAIVALGENESIDISNPARPNVAFDGFVSSMCKQIGSALEVPYELLLKHFSASYSASRASLLEAWKMFRMRRSWMANDFCQPIYEEFLAEAISKGRISAPGFFTDPLARKAYCTAEWNGPSQGQIDPLKEVNAASKRVAEGFSTRTKETVELGNGDFFRNNRLRIVEEKLRREGGLTSDNSNSTDEDTEDPDETDINEIVRR